MSCQRAAQCSPLVLPVHLCHAPPMHPSCISMSPGGFTCHQLLVPRSPHDTISPEMRSDCPAPRSPTSCLLPDILTSPCPLPLEPHCPRGGARHPSLCIFSPASPLCRCLVPVEPVVIPFWVHVLRYLSTHEAPPAACPQRSPSHAPDPYCMLMLHPASSCTPLTSRCDRTSHRPCPRDSSIFPRHPHALAVPR